MDGCSAYEIGILWSGGVFGAVWLYIVFAHLLAMAKGFVKDASVVWPSWSMANRRYGDGADALAQTLLFGLIGLVSAFLWPLAWLVAVVSVVLLGLRQAHRLTRALNEHKHDAKGNVIHRQKLNW